jgi:hypothetical protein
MQKMGRILYQLIPGIFKKKASTEDYFDKEYALLNIQSSLVGEITPELRAVAAELKPEKEEIKLSFFYDCVVDDEILTLASFITMEIDVDRHPKRITHVIFEALECKYPQEIPPKGILVYKRKEEPLEIRRKNREVTISLPPDLKAKEPVTVNFQKPIGYAIKNRFPLEKIPTSWGVVYFSSAGAHVIPRLPKVKQTIDHAYLRLSVQSALLGIVTDSLRAVTLNLFDIRAKIFFFYDGQIPEESLELAKCAFAEIAADFPPDYVIQGEILRLDAPSAIPSSGFYAYERKEPDRSSFFFLSPLYNIELKTQ